MDKNKEFLSALKRGVVNIVSEEELSKKLSSGKPLRVKLGVDPTSPDLHLGHTVLLHKLRIFQEYGHKIVFIIGDFTALIGDPSGHDETRPVLSKRDISDNAGKYQEQVFTILDKKNVEVVYNSEWLIKIFNSKDISELHKNMQSLFGSYTVGQLMEREDFTKRRQEGKPITLLELMYPIFQAYDSVIVKSDIELGGNDQLFNLMMGRELQRDFGQEPQVVMTMPLLVGTDGVRKMSKSYDNYIALNEPAKDMYGKIMSISDETMRAYYELLTGFDMKKVETDIKSVPRDTKARLAFEITSRYRGRDAAKEVQEEFDRVFSKKELPDEMPEYRTTKREWKLADILVEAKLAPSKKEARRLISQGAVSIDNIKVKSEEFKLDKDSVLVKVGKRRFCKVCFET
jgi:tyrosyl-tRNA synthetase